MLIVSIDPGLTGACAVQSITGGLLVVFDLPTMPVPGVGAKALVKRKIDGVALKRAIRAAVPAGEAWAAVIESVGTMGGANNAVQTQGSLLRTLGAVETVLELLGGKPAYVSPLAWKRHFALIDSGASGTARKAASLALARSIWPECREFERALDHNRAEAALIGRWMLDREA